MMDNTLHIISGPTAAGKTEYALDYADKHNAEIVSCDSLLVYQGMNIGTAKPTIQELERIPHHLIDLNPVDKPYTIVNYVADAKAAVEAVAADGKPIVIVGGSGFYLKSFFVSVIDTVAFSEEAHAVVEDINTQRGLEGLLEELGKRSPDGLGNLDIFNPRRVIRALERCIASGKSLLELQADFAAQPEPFAGWKKHYILLERDSEKLKHRVERRVDMMLEAGLIKEVESLRKLGIERNSSAASAIGYRETLKFLNGELSREALASVIVQNTNQLVKKQRTWFRTQIREPDERIIL